MAATVAGSAAKDIELARLTALLERQADDHLLVIAAKDAEITYLRSLVDRLTARPELVHLTAESMAEAREKIAFEAPIEKALRHALDGAPRDVVRQVRKNVRRWLELDVSPDEIVLRIQKGDDPSRLLASSVEGLG